MTNQLDGAKEGAAFLLAKEKNLNRTFSLTRKVGVIAAGSEIFNRFVN